MSKIKLLSVLGQFSSLHLPGQASLREAYAAIKELVEADLALDQALMALATTRPQSEDAETISAMRARRDQCRARRRTALAKFRED